MARIDMDAFDEGTEIVRVYLAASLGEAQRVERVLDDAGVDYAVEVEEFRSPTALGSNALRRGAGFWLRESSLEHAYVALELAGCVAGLVDRGP